MSMVAVQDPLDVTRASTEATPLSAAVVAQSAPPAEKARVLREAIDHHREEGRRLAAEAKHHRTLVTVLLELRRQHAAELHAAGWNLGRIGRLYQLTRERVRQLVTATRQDTDDGTAVAR